MICCMLPHAAGSVVPKLFISLPFAISYSTTETALKANFVFAELNESQLDSMVLAFERQKVQKINALEIAASVALLTLCSSYVCRLKLGQI